MRFFRFFMLFLMLSVLGGTAGIAAESDFTKDEVEEIIAPEGVTDSKSDGEALLIESKQAMIEGDLVRALQLAMDAEALFEEATDAEKIVKSYILRAEIQLQMRERDIATEILQAALERFPETSRLQLILNILVNIFIDLTPMIDVSELSTYVVLT